MATAKAWGTITIVDTTDIGQFSVTPSSNRATTVIYTPDNNTYRPNWAETSGNVTITPIVYYGGTQLTPGNNPTVTWAYKTNDTTTFTTITSSSPSWWAKPQSNGTLKLTGNPFTSTGISSVTIKCTANYNEPATNLPLTAAGEITYSVVRQAASVPYVRITGGNVFKYNTSQSLVGAESITLTANHAHCTIERWEYMDANGWTAIANTTGVETLTINAKSTAHDVYFKNDIATFRVVTSVDGLIDVHVITKIHDGAAGQSAYVGIISTPNGNVFSNGAGSLLLTAQLYLGSDDVSSASSFQWAKFSGSAYTNLSDETSSTLSVDGDTVDGLASYRCTISHNSAVRAVLYATLIDKTDPIQAEILSTAGDKFVNGVAEGAMYVKVYRNGVEIDPFPTEVISKTAPTNPKAGAMYFKIDTATNSVKLMKYVSGAWAEQTYTPTAKYTWSYLDKDGKEVHPSGMATSGKIIYVDGDFVNVKLTAFCKVEV